MQGEYVKDSHIMWLRLIDLIAKHIGLVTTDTVGCKADDCQNEESWQ